MTICIAAICANGNGIVAAADRQVTVSALALEVERPKSKISQLGFNQIVMAAGDGLIAHELTHSIAPAARGGMHVEDLAQMLQTNYVAMRQKRVEDQALRPMGHDWQSFTGEGLKSLGQLFPNILQQVAQFNLQAEFLLSGFSESGSARIALVTHPGVLMWIDGLEFYAVGSGANHAFSGLLLTGYSSADPIDRVLLSVYRAKRAAELAPGVGNATDIVFADRTRSWRASEKVLQELESLHEAAVQRERTTDDCAKLKEVIDATAPAKDA